MAGRGLIKVFLAGVGVSCPFHLVFFINKLSDVLLG
jgi:hypothetical protein